LCLCWLRDRLLAGRILLAEDGVDNQRLISLLLRKATGEMPHGGGARLERGTADYQTLVNWIAQGARGIQAGEPVVTKIEVSPAEVVLARGAEQQLTVTAHLSNGTQRDITSLACYDSGSKDLAEVDAGGHVHLGQLTGDVAVMVRFQEHVAVFRATAPLGAPVENLPAPRNYIDELVFAKLKAMGLTISLEVGYRLSPRGEELLRRLG